jgi:Tfp pilus assembly protein PilX
MNVKKKLSSDQGGFVMVIVLLLLAVILSAGLFGLKMLASDSRSHQRFARNLAVSRAASAGAAHRVAQLEMTKNDPMSAIESHIDWTQGPAADANTAPDTQYMATAEPVVITSAPPAGAQLGSAAPQTLLWQIRSYSIPADFNNGSQTLAPALGGEHGVSMGVKIVTSGSQSYNMD